LVSLPAKICAFFWSQAALSALAAGVLTGLAGPETPSVSATWFATGVPPVRGHGQDGRGTFGLRLRRPAPPCCFPRGILDATAGCWERRFGSPGHYPAQGGATNEFRESADGATEAFRGLESRVSMWSLVPGFVGSPDLILPSLLTVAKSPWRHFGAELLSRVCRLGGSGPNVP
jgi:hypothetical protein